MTLALCSGMASAQSPDPADQPISQESSELIDLTAVPPVPPLLDEARNLVGAQDYPHAIEAFQKYLETAPDDRQARLELARVYSWTKHFPEAIALYNRLLDEDADDPAFRLERARVLLWAGHYKDGLGALRGLRAELRQNQEAGQAVSPELLEDITRTLADGLAWSGDALAAVHEFGTLALEHPEDASLQLALARALRDAKAVDPALEHYGTYLRLRPDDTAVELERARLLVWNARYPEAIRALTALHNQPAGRDEADRLLSQALLWSHDVYKALPVLQMLAARHPEDASLLLDQARALLQMGRLEEARAAFARYLALGGSPAEAALGLGETFRRDGDPLRARRAYRMGVLQSPPAQEIVSALHSLEPDLRWMTPGTLRLRADVSGFLQETLSARTEIPAGLVWVGPQLELDHFSGNSTSGDIWRFALAAAARYHHNAHLELNTVVGLQGTTLSDSPLPGTTLQDGPSLTPRLQLDVHWTSMSVHERIRNFGTSATSSRFPADPTRIEARLEYSDATEVLFTRRALEAGIQQLAASLTASAAPVGGWQAWGQVREAHLLEPAGSTNDIMQIQGSFGRALAPAGGQGLEVALTAGALHATHDLTGEAQPMYWSPAYYLNAGLRLGLTASPFAGMSVRARVRGGIAGSSEVSTPFPEVTVELSIDHRISDRFGWRTSAGYGRTVRTNSYWSTQGTLEAWYRF